MSFLVPGILAESHNPSKKSTLEAHTNADLTYHLELYFTIVTYNEPMNPWVQINYYYENGQHMRIIYGVDGTALPSLNLNYRKLSRASITGVQGIAGEQSFYQEEALIMFREEDSTTYLFPIGVHIPKKADFGHDRELQRRLPSILGRDIINQCDLSINYQRGTMELIPPEGARRPMPTRRLL